MKRLLIALALVGTALARKPIDFEIDSVTVPHLANDPGEKGGSGPKEIDSLYYYNEVAYNAIGTPCGSGLTHWAARFTIDPPHAGKLTEAGVFIYIGDYGPMPTTGTMNVNAGTATDPGAPLGAGYTFGPVQVDSWQVYDCSTEDIQLSPGLELWVWARQQHNSGQFPAAVDHGPCVVNYGCWLSLDGINWQGLGCGGSYNWNIYAIVDLTGVQEGPAPDRLALSFSSLNCGQATIEYTIPEDSRVSLKVYDPAGRLKMTLRNGPTRAGRYAALISGLAPGTYTVSLTAGSQSLSERMVVTR